MIQGGVSDQAGLRRSGTKTLAAWLCIAAVVCLTIWAYKPALDARWVLDDVRNIVDSPALRWTELSVENVKSVWDSALLRTRLVANLSFAIDHWAWGLEPRGFHATNIAIHLAVGLALLWLCVLYASVTSGLPARPKPGRLAMLALAPVALFLLHPLNTQAVTYVVQRMASMAALFTLVAFACYLVARYRLTSRSTWWYAAALLAWALGMGSKENAILLLPVIFLYEACFFRGDWRARAEKALGGTWTSTWTLVFWAGLAVAVGAVLAIAMVSSVSIGLTAEFPGRDFNGLERIVTQARVQIFHLSQLVWPSPGRLNLDHDFMVSRSLLEPLVTLPAVLVCCALLASAVLLAIRRPRYGFPLVAYAIFHALEAGPVSLEIIFEHRMYLPMTMLALLLAALLADVKSQRRILIVALCGVALIFGAWTYSRNLVWAEPLGLERDMASKSPRKARTQYNYAKALADAGRGQEAVPVLQRALDLESDEWRLSALLGEVLLELGRPVEAVSAYREALRLQPDSVRAALGLGQALASSGAEQTAFEHYMGTGIRLAQGGRPFEAIPILEAAVDLRADHAGARNALGNTYAGAGWPDKAIEQFKLSIEQDENQYEAWYNLGVVAESSGLRDEAIAAYEGFLNHAPPDLRQPIVHARARLQALRAQAGE